jgi:hypothetical protein
MDFGRDKEGVVLELKRCGPSRWDSQICRGEKMERVGLLQVVGHVHVDTRRLLALGKTPLGAAGIRHVYAMRAACPVRLS